jgi:ESS family glutamate:Na+ symporter
MSQTLTFDVPSTLACAALVLVVGRKLVDAVPVLKRYSIPAAVVGGLLAALIATVLHTRGVMLAFDKSLQPGLMLAFFATVGLGADVRMLARGGKLLFTFSIAIAVMLIVQNVVGVGAAKLLGVDPLLGLLAGSISMAGGHGTAAAWGQKFSEAYGMTAAPALGIAAATFGLVAGGLLGGPVARRLVERLAARGMLPVNSGAGAGPNDGAKAHGPLTAYRLIFTILLITACMVLGSHLVRWAEHPSFTLPAFVWTLFAGAVLRNLLALFKWHEVDGEALEFAGSVALSLFLAIALMSLRLWEVASLAGPMLLILLLQVVAVAMVATVLTYRLCGSDYEAAVLVAGQCGFGLGATPTAIANMQAVTERFGYARQAFIVVPVVGAFLIDILNAVVIGGFVGWLGQGR